ncbi:CBS domain-containing protein [Pradoshia sp. D12]|jgi:CBS domain-containing protein|uniref:CBS domain-containing protein n=1 Tax=Bacillaceae TaxID=186817 RepID=UPI00080AE691|nr:MULTISPECIES: CBS domain-containing protein [Bacillaceae]OCA86637.1 CBS domain-containing protein [Bacillus sp. FJAT-27986]QFK71589.1 CBS domain-containing protein [Pradoshia sp. D12]TPF73384.1 CBS domain-containing protein [Bacillus sp. D12]
MTMLREIMTTNVDYVTPLDNVYEVALKMKEDNVGIIPVCEDNTLIGIITDRDLVVDGIAEKRPGSTRVTDVMHQNVVTANPDTTEEEAAALMAQHQIRRLPVLENGKLVGIVSLGDLAVSYTGNDEAGEALQDISEEN